MQQHHFFDNSCSPICRAVINDNNFKICVCLKKNRVKRILYIFLGVKGWNTDANLRINKSDQFYTFLNTIV